MQRRIGAAFLQSRAPGVALCAGPVEAEQIEEVEGAGAALWETALAQSKPGNNAYISMLSSLIAGECINTFKRRVPNSCQIQRHNIAIDCPTASCGLLQPDASKGAPKA